MDIVSVLSLFAGAVSLTALVLLLKLRSTQLELERTQRRMARLDELADGIARETSELPALRSADRLRRYDTPVPAFDSGKFETVGLEFNTEDVIEEIPFKPAALVEDDDFAAPRLGGVDDDFAAPRMGSVADDIPPRLVPQRPRRDTPVTTPHGFAPRNTDSLVAVGSIQVRSDEIDRIPED